jgi:hypothetical protein
MGVMILLALIITRVLYSVLNCASVVDNLHVMSKRKAKEEKMLSVKEAAERIGSTPASVRVWAWQGRFPGAKKETTPLGEYWLIPESDVAGFQKGKAGRPLKGDQPVRKSRRKIVD